MDEKEALLYTKDKGASAICAVCPHRCRIAPGKTGYCGVRSNEGGTLYSLIYNKVSSLANDPIEKKPLYHFHPGSRVLSAGSVGCNLRCMHCQNYSISQVRPSGAMLRTVTAEQFIAYAQQEGCAGVAWTYNEPTIWLEYMLEGAQLAKKAGLYTVSVTNGYITEEALELIGPYIEAYALDIKGWTKKFAKEVCGVPDLAPVLEAAKLMRHRWKAHVEVTTNIIPGHNDDDEQLRSIAKWIVKELGAEVPWHVSRAFPRHKMHFDPTPLESLQRARDIGLSAGLQLVHVGNV